ncbi:hypothetical protein OG900_28480 [Streptomyces sp. NBC_00433]
MSLELPGWVVDAFNFLGLPWPAIDEDELRGWAKDLREFTTEITQLSQLSHDAVHGLKDTNQSGAVSTLAEHWDHHHSQMMAMRGPMHDFAGALDIAAKAVEIQKGVVIAEASALAAEVIATQGEALFTLGIAEGELPLEIALTKTAVKFVLQELENKIVGYLVNQAAEEVSNNVSATVSKMLTGSTTVVFETLTLKADYQALQRVAATARTHKSRVENASIRAHRRANARKIETHSAGGKWHVVQVLEAALKSIAEDIFRKLPGTLHRVLDETEKDLEKAAAKLKATDGKVADDAPKPLTEETPLPDGSGGGIPPVKPPERPAGSARYPSPEDPMAVVRIQVDKANSDRTWFEQHYRSDGHRHSTEGRDENGNPLPQLKPDPTRPGKWIPASDAPPPLPPLYKDGPSKVGDRPGDDHPHQKALDEAAAKRQRAIDADQAAHQAQKDAQAAYDANPTPGNKRARDDANTAHPPLHDQMSRAGEDLGDAAAANHAIPENFPGATRVDNRARGKNRFDQIWRRPDGGFVVVEAKASPTTRLGDRASLPDGPLSGRQVMQGHRAYFEAIIVQMEKRGAGDLDEAKLAVELQKALDDNKLDYVVVKAKSEDGQYDGYVMRHFDIDQGS